jgi:hypothetical protein
MGTGELNLLNSGVWLIPLLLIAILGGLFLLVRYWRDKTQQNLKQMRSELRRLQNRRKELMLIAQEFSEDDPEPYASQAAELHARLADITQRLEEIERQHVAVQEHAHNLQSTRIQANIAAPYFYYLLQKDIGALWEQRAEVETALEATARSIEKTQKIAWEVAVQSRKAFDAQQRTSDLLDTLRSRSVSGPAMDEAARKLEQNRRLFRQIPAVFIEGDEKDVLERTDQESVVRAYEVVSQTGPVFSELLAQAEDWERQYRAASDRVSVMRQVLLRLEQTMDSMPAGLNLTDIRSQYDQLQIIAETLHATMNRLEIESAPKVAEEAGRVRKTAQDMEGLLRRAKQEHSELERLLSDLSENLRQLSAQFSDLGTHATHPILWDKSRDVLTSLSRQSAALGPSKKARTPEQVEADLASAREIAARQQELSRHCQAIAHQHGELLQLLNSPEWSQADEWLQTNRRLVTRLREYDPENWARVDSLGTLIDDLKKFSEGYRQVKAAGPGEPIPEQDLEKYLENVRQLTKLQQNLQSRTEKVRERLEEVQHSEKFAQEQLDSLRAALNQVGLLVRSNPFLTELAGQELSRLQGSLEEASASLKDRAHGPIEGKARAVGALAGRVEQALNSWLDRFGKEIDAQIKALGSQLAELEAIAHLDEPAVAEAQRILGSGQTFSKTGLGLKPKMGLEDQILELKRRSDYWQKSVGAMQALEDVARPVIDTHREARDNRQYAKEKMAEIAAWMRGLRHWPPSSVSLESEQQELANIEEQWEALRSQPAKAIHLVGQLSNLSARYYALAEKAFQSAERAAIEQQQVHEMEAQLEEMAQLWQNQWYAYRDNPVTGEEIRLLLNDVDKEHNQLKRRYRQGDLDYNEVVLELQELQRRLRSAQVSIDETHVIDLNGRIIAYR